MLPIVLVAPHSKSTIHDELKDRFALSDYEIWKCSDPYTDQLDEFTCASSIHKADISRLVCDLNRAPNIEDSFREFDFFGRTAFNKGDEFTTHEKESFLMKYWYPFHQGVVDSVQRLDEEDHEVILLVDYHNTSGDHALNRNNDYMSSMIFSNLGSEDAYDNYDGLSIPYDYLFELQDSITDQLGISVEINRIYKGGYNLYWYAHLKDILDINAKIYAVQIEYNLDYVFNPTTQTFDENALRIMQEALNNGLVGMYEAICNKEDVHQKTAIVAD